MSASDVIFIPDRTKDLASRDKETVLALVSLENAYITNVQYLRYVESLPPKVGLSAVCDAGPREDPRSRALRVGGAQAARGDEHLLGRDRRAGRASLRARGVAVRAAGARESAAEPEARADLDGAALSRDLSAAAQPAADAHARRLAEGSARRTRTSPSTPARRRRGCC